MKTLKVFLSLTLSMSLVTGCAVGPNYARPKVDVPGQYRGLPPDAQTQIQGASLGNVKWWDVFKDPTLQDLIKAALKENYDVRIAAARILEARAQLGISRADQYPNVSAGYSAVDERIPPEFGRPAIEANLHTVSASVAWELDFWGKYRRATESARANLLANEWSRQQVISSLIGDVASAYFQLRELDLELDISRKTLAERKDSLRLTQLLSDHGSTSLLDVRQAEQLVYNAAANIPDLERKIAQQENFLSTLLGKNPGDVPRGLVLTEQPHAPEVPAGLPSALLERRPDIREAEQQLVALNAQIGVAKADYFPSIALTGTGGFQSSALTSLFSGPAGLWSFGGSVTQPVFEGGRIRNRVRFAEARRDEATLVYQQTIQQAFREVADSLIAYQKNQEFRVQQEQVTRAAVDATRLSNMRYKGGATSYLEVLDSHTRQFAAQITLAQAQLNELQSMVRIYRALGGGWQQ
jgi:multidrug efflux system outer membrane protein